MSIYKDGKLIAGGRQTMPLLSFMWADHQLNDVSWLRADTFSWQSGAVYQVAYEHLVDDISGKPLISETISGVTVQFCLADDGHKICPATQESNVAAIYATTGVAWYYILDIVNQRFKLPRTKFGFTGIRTGVGEFVDAGLPDIQAYNGTNLSDSGTPGGAFQSQGKVAGNGGGSGGQNRMNFYAHLYNSIYGNSDTVQPKATEMYLYFYVGQFTQTALENTAGINTEMFNDLNAHKVIEFQEPTADNNYTWYRKYADGWVEQGGHIMATTSAWASTTITLPVTMANRYYCISRAGNWSDAASSSCTITAMTTTTFTITYALNTIDYGGTMWEVKGMAA